MQLELPDGVAAADEAGVRPAADDEAGVGLPAEDGAGGRGPANRGGGRRRQRPAGASEPGRRRSGRALSAWSAAEGAALVRTRRSRCAVSCDGEGLRHGRDG